MIEMATRGGIEPTLGSRGPAYAVIQKFLSVQQDAGPRGAVERFFGMSPLLPEARAWYAGAMGELDVAETLANLGAGWSILHNLPIGGHGAEIDHLAVGPAGVFSITTATYPGKRIFVGRNIFQVGATRKKYLRRAESQAIRASRRLSTVVGAPVHVTPLIAVAAAASLTLGEPRSLVDVFETAHLGRWLRKRRTTLTADAVAGISRAASLRSTWHADAVVVAESRVNLQRFERVRGEVERAAGRARLWKLLGGVTALIVITAFFAKVLPILAIAALSR
jgi:hypothetical protein